MRVLRWPGNFVRAVFVVLVVLVCLLIYGLGRLGTLVLRGERRRATVARLRGRVLRRGMMILGATFIKVGQVMSTRPDLFPPEVIEELKVLQDQLPPFDFRRVRWAIEDDHGQRLYDVFKSINKEPVAAASVAQVHYAVLKDGTEVAVKVLRPNIRRQVERDAAILLTGARILALHPQARLSDPVGHLRQFVNAIIEQTDLRIEARHYERFNANFNDVDEVDFPKVYLEHSSQYVLTMDYIHGTKVTELEPGAHKQLATVLRNMIFKMIFVDGFVHADLHPGNMLVRDNGQLVLFDVGLSKLLTDDILLEFTDMTKCLAMGTPETLVAHLRRFHTYLDDVDWDALREDIAEFEARFRGQDVSKLEYGALINEMLALGRRYRVRPVVDMTMILVALITAEGLGKRLNPDMNVFDELAKYLIPILQAKGESVPDSEHARRAQTALDAD